MVDGGAAGQEGVSLGRTTVVLQGPEERIDARKVTRGGQVAGVVAVQVVTFGGDDASVAIVATIKNLSSVRSSRLRNSA